MKLLSAVLLAVTMLPVVKPTLNRRFTQPTVQDSLIVDEWKKTIVEKKQPLSIDSLAGGADVLVFGENHDENFQRYFLASHMQDFYNQGYSHLCLEMPSDLQEKLHFMRMIVRLRNMNAEVNQGEEMFLNCLKHYYPDEMAEGMYALIDAAYSAGMEVYAIDVPSYQKPQPTNYPFWLIDERERYMTEEIKSILRDGGKPIALVGLMHYQLANEIENSRFVSFPSADSLDYFYKAASALGLEDTIMICDGKFSVVYIPQKK